MREEENRNAQNSGAKRLFRKKWFFPAVYLTTAALLLTGVLWYQSSINDSLDEVSDDVTPDHVENQDPVDITPFNEDYEAEPVMVPEENVQMPVQQGEESVIVTKFYDYGASSEDQEKALVLFNNKYYQSTGLDIAREDGKSFDVTASVSGTVTEVLEDPILGNVVRLSHKDNVTTHYAALSDVLVEVGAEVQQGDVIGRAGQNLYGQAAGVHVHFEIRKDNEPLNPETYFNQPLSEVKPPAEDDGEPEDDKETDEDSSSSISMATT